MVWNIVVISCLIMANRNITFGNVYNWYQYSNLSTYLESYIPIRIIVETHIVGSFVSPSMFYAGMLKIKLKHAVDAHLPRYFVKLRLAHNYNPDKKWHLFRFTIVIWGKVLWLYTDCYHEGKEKLVTSILFSLHKTSRRLGVVFIFQVWEITASFN